MFKISTNCRHSEQYYCYIYNYENDERPQYLHSDGTIHPSTKNEHGYMGGWYKTENEAQMVLDRYNASKSKFKVGDKVKCIDASGIGFTEGLMYGVIYEILELNPTYSSVTVKLSNGRQCCYNETRFELVKEPEIIEFKIGDKVRCLHDADDQFTKGKIYTVAGLGFHSYLDMIDDKGKPNGWHKEHFELVKDPEWTIKDIGYVIYSATDSKLGRYYIARGNIGDYRDFLYPDGSIHDSCWIDDYHHGWYMNKEEAEKVLNKYLSPKTYEDGWNDAINHMQNMLDNMKNKV